MRRLSVLSLPTQLVFPAKTNSPDSRPSFRLLSPCCTSISVCSTRRHGAIVWQSNRALTLSKIWKRLFSFFIYFFQKNGEKDETAPLSLSRPFLFFCILQFLHLQRRQQRRRRQRRRRLKTSSSLLLSLSSSSSFLTVPTIIQILVLAFLYDSFETRLLWFWTLSNPGKGPFQVWTASSSSLQTCKTLNPAEAVMLNKYQRFVSIIKTETRVGIQQKLFTNFVWSCYSKTKFSDFRSSLLLKIQK